MIIHTLHPGFKERLISFFERKRRPILHGEISLEFGYSLEQVSRELSPLIEQNVIVQLTSEELKNNNLDTRLIAYKIKLV